MLLAKTQITSEDNKAHHLKVIYDKLSAIRPLSDVAVTGGVAQFLQIRQRSICLQLTHLTVEHRHTSK